jgi:hypothetical protein
VKYHFVITVEAAFTGVTNGMSRYTEAGTIDMYEWDKPATVEAIYNHLKKTATEKAEAGMPILTSPTEPASATTIVWSFTPDDLTPRRRGRPGP